MQDVRMKAIYVSDLHGHTAAYEKTFERAVSAGVRAIINGGDIYPLAPDLFTVQKKFISGYLSEYLDRCARAGLHYLCTLGNMDLRGLDSEFLQVINSAPNAYSLLNEKVEFEGYTFIGSPMTADGPFALKDRCLIDTDHSSAPPVSGRALISDSEGIHDLENWEKARADLPSLSSHLADLPRPAEPERTVYVLHQPPLGARLGMISETIDVGSQAVADFLTENKPRISLHGHIHESPFVGGCWRSSIGETVCIQPGQLTGTGCVSVVIDFESLEMTRSC
jgi:uncharacterized protein